VANRKVVADRFEKLGNQFPDGNIPMPEHWGGYRLLPVMLEFWQGRQNRLHDRLRYRLQGNSSWLIERLEP
jgi:pyridoxamine 5'-phosphate oxidase